MCSSDLDVDKGRQQQSFLFHFPSPIDMAYADIGGETGRGEEVKKVENRREEERKHGDRRGGET